MFRLQREFLKRVSGSLGCYKVSKPYCSSQSCIEIICAYGSLETTDYLSFEMLEFAKEAFMKDGLAFLIEAHLLVAEFCSVSLYSDSFTSTDSSSFLVGG